CPDTPQFSSVGGPDTDRVMKPTNVAVDDPELCAIRTRVYSNYASRCVGNGGRPQVWAHNRELLDAKSQARIDGAQERRRIPGQRPEIQSGCSEVVGIPGRAARR